MMSGSVDVKLNSTILHVSDGSCIALADGSFVTVKVVSSESGWRMLDKFVVIYALLIAVYLYFFRTKPPPRKATSYIVKRIIGEAEKERISEHEHTEWKNDFHGTWYLIRRENFKEVSRLLKILTRLGFDELLLPNSVSSSRRLLFMESLYGGIFHADS